MSHRGNEVDPAQIYGDNYKTDNRGKKLSGPDKVAVLAPVRLEGEKKQKLKEKKKKKILETFRRRRPQSGGESLGRLRGRAGGENGENDESQRAHQNAGRWSQGQRPLRWLQQDHHGRRPLGHRAQQQELSSPGEQARKTCWVCFMFVCSVSNASRAVEFSVARKKSILKRETMRSAMRAS
jgi:hypothetical protein